MVPYGSTGVQVSEITLGGHEFLKNGRSRGFNDDFSNAVTPGYLLDGFGGQQRREVLKAAYDLGINMFDVTIDSEKEALGRNFAEMPPPYEVYVQTRPEGMCYSYDPGNRKLLDYGLLRSEVERILKLIRRERVDFLNVGLMKWSIDQTPDYMARLGENLRRLRDDGLIRFAVADSFSGQRLYLAQIASGAFDAVNLDLSFGEPSALRTVIPAAREKGLGVMGREVFFKGELFDIAAEAGLSDRGTVARAALAWVAQHRPDTIILGVDTAEQLKANACTLATQESPAVDEILSRIGQAQSFQEYESKRTAAFFEE